MMVMDENVSAKISPLYEKMSLVNETVRPETETFDFQSETRLRHSHISPRRDWDVGKMHLLTETLRPRLHPWLVALLYIRQLLTEPVKTERFDRWRDNNVKPLCILEFVDWLLALCCSICSIGWNLSSQHTDSWKVCALWIQSVTEIY